MDCIVHGVAKSQTRLCDFYSIGRAKPPQALTPFCPFPRIHCPLLLLFSCKVVSDSFVTPWTIARQAPLSTGFSRQEYWGGLPFSSVEDPPNPRIKPESPVLTGSLFPTDLQEDLGCL